MYERIMDLPLFKGVGRNQISQFLEKTQLRFTNYEKDEIVATRGEQCTTVRYLISGRVRVIRSNAAGTLTLAETSERGRVFGVDRLYGLDTSLPFTVKALEGASLMEFSKEQFQTLLYSDNIHMLNFFNYLSLRAQRPIDSLALYTGGDLASRLALWVSVATDPDGSEITVSGDPENLMTAAHVGEEEFHEQLETLRRKRLITYGRRSIRVISRAKLLEYPLTSPK